MEADIRDRLLDLRRARGMLAAHDKCLDNINQQIAAVETELGIREDRQAAEQAMQQELNAEQTQAAIKAARTEIEDLKSASAKALAESRAGYVQGAASMKTHLQTEASLRKAQMKLNALTGEKTSITNEFELHGKRALQIASTIRSITNHPSYFGSLAGKISYPNTLPTWKE